MSNEKLAEALQACMDCMLERGVSTDPDHPRRMAFDSGLAALQAHAAGAVQAQAQSGSLDELLIERGSATRDVRDNRILAFVTANQAQTLLDAFGGSSAIYALIHCERGQCAPRDDGSESPEGLYVYDINYPEEGVIYLGDEDEESEPREEVPQPQQAQDAEVGESQHPIENAVDARRYRWLAEHPRNGIMNIDGHAQDVSHYGIACVHGMSLSDAIDAAMAREAGR